MKKIVSALLAALMLLSLCALAETAAPVVTVDGAEWTAPAAGEAVSLEKDLGVIVNNVFYAAYSPAEPLVTALGEPDETVCVLTPDDVCLRDAARLCEVFADRKLPTPRVIVNRLQEDLIRLGEMRGAQACADRLGLRLLGEVPEDPSVYRAQLNRIRLTDIDCEARRAVERIAGRMRGREIPLPRYGAGKLSWWKRRRLRSLKEV